jgi:hypothetical protein
VRSLLVSCSTAGCCDLVDRSRNISSNDDLDACAEAQRVAILPSISLAAARAYVMSPNCRNCPRPSAARLCVPPNSHWHASSAARMLGLFVHIISEGMLLSPLYWHSGLSFAQLQILQH